MIAFGTKPCSIGALVGYLVSAVLIAVFGGVVNALVVCFAESPATLEKNHPVSNNCTNASFEKVSE